MIIDCINNEIIRKKLPFHFIEYGNKQIKQNFLSQMEQIFQHLEVCETTILERNHHAGKIFKLSL
jgi:hypothetical protein